MSKKGLVILIIVILIIASIIAFYFLQKAKNISPEKFVSTVNPTNEQNKEVQEVVSFVGTISSIDTENKFLMVKPENETKEIKIVISDGTVMKKLSYPENMSESEETPVAVEKIIGISGLSKGESIYVWTTTSLVGKTELNDVELVLVVPK